MVEQTLQSTSKKAEQKQLAGSQNRISKELAPVTIALVMVLQAKLCPETTPSEWVKILTYMHSKGWLYFGVENGRIKALVAAYRVDNYDAGIRDSLPKEESGNILHAPCVVSFSKNKFLILKMLSSYLKNHPNVEKVVYHDRNEVLREFKIKRGNNGKK